MLCENCGTECDGKFCPNCGKLCSQKVIPNTSTDVMEATSSEIGNANVITDNIENVQNQNVASTLTENSADVNENIESVLNQNIANETTKNVANQDIASANNEKVVSANQEAVSTLNQNVASVTNQGVANATNQNVASQNIYNIKPVRTYIEKRLSGFAFAKSIFALFIGIMLGVCVGLISFWNGYDGGNQLTLSGTIAVVLGFFGTILFLATGISQYEKLTRNSKIKILIPFVMNFAGPVSFIGTPWFIINILTLGLRKVRQKINKDKNSQNDYAVLCNYNSIFTDIIALILLFTAAIVMIVEGVRFNTNINIYNLFMIIFGAIVLVLSLITTMLIAIKYIVEFVGLNGKNTKLSEIEVNAVEGVIAVNKKSYKKLIAMAIVCAMIMVVIIPVSAVGLDKFTRVKYINVNLSIEEVEKHLGEPDFVEKGVYEYYSDNYLRLAQKIEKLEEEMLGIESIAADFDEGDLEDWMDDIDKELGELDKKLKEIERLKEKLNNLNYKYIRVEFYESDGDSSNNGQSSSSFIKSVYYDSRKCDAGAVSSKRITNIKIDGKTTVSQYESIDIKYTIHYNDNSLYMGGFNGFATIAGDNLENLPLNISVNEIKKLTSDAVKNILSQYSGEQKTFYVPETVEVIESNALYYTSVDTVSIGKNIKRIKKNAIGGRVKVIYYSGTEAEWGKVKKDRGWYASYDGIRVICSDSNYED